MLPSVDWLAIVQDTDLVPVFVRNLAIGLEYVPVPDDGNGIVGGLRGIDYVQVGIPAGDHIVTPNRLIGLFAGAT